MATAPTSLPFPNINQPLVNLTTGCMTDTWYKYFKQFDNSMRSLVGTSAVALTTAGGVSLSGGFEETPFDLGTPANGATITPNPSDNLKQTVANDVVAFTIAATAEVGDVELTITNGATAGAIAFSGFTKSWGGDALDTTAGHSFVVFIYGHPNGLSSYLIKALQ